MTSPCMAASRGRQLGLDGGDKMGSAVLIVVHLGWHRPLTQTSHKEDFIFRARRTDRQTDRQTHWALLRLPSGPRPEGQEMRNLLGALGKGFCGHGKRPAGGAMRCSHHHRQLGHRCCFNDDDCTASWGADQPPIIHRMRSSRRPVPNTTTARFFARLRGRMQ